MIRPFVLVVSALVVCAAGALAQSRYGKADRRDAIFLRFP